MQTEYKVGDRITVTHTGVVTHVDEFGIDYKTGVGNYVHSVWPRELDAITRTEPANWPPRPGDVWEAFGKLYGVRAYSFSADTPIVGRVDGEGLFYGDPYPPEAKLDKFKALNPELVKRQNGN